jgi:hypothetical protein
MTHCKLILVRPKLSRVKANVILLLLCTLFYGSESNGSDAPEVTSKVVEKDLHGGKVHVHMETFYRDKMRVLRIWRQTEAGITKTTRHYQVGDIEVIESDDKGDGTFDTLILFNTKTKEMEAYLRKPDGSARPVNEKALAATKQQFEALESFWNETLGRGVGTEKFLEAGKELKKKLKEAEEQKQQDNK